MQQSIKREKMLVAEKFMRYQVPRYGKLNVYINRYIFYDEVWNV
jgi:hypothetical protein